MSRRRHSMPRPSTTFSPASRRLPADGPLHLASLLDGAHGRPHPLLEEGRLVEQGTHEELLLQGGRYAALFELQAASYR